MTPTDWEEFEGKMRQHYSSMLVWELMNEEGNLMHILNNADRFPQFSMLDLDKLNLRLRIVTQTIGKRIDDIIARSVLNGD